MSAGSASEKPLMKQVFPGNRLLTGSYVAVPIRVHPSKSAANSSYSCFSSAIRTEKFHPAFNSLRIKPELEVRWDSYRAERHFGVRLAIAPKSHLRGMTL
jgi:hypothetical protein